MYLFEWNYIRHQIERCATPTRNRSLAKEKRECYTTYIKPHLKNKIKNVMEKICKVSVWFSRMRGSRKLAIIAGVHRPYAWKLYKTTRVHVLATLPVLGARPIAKERHRAI